MKILAPRLAATALLAAIAARALPAQGHLFTVDRYADLERVGDAQVAPDGKRIVYTRTQVDRMHDRWTSMLWVMDADGSEPRQLVDGSGARWSPDGSRIAYVAPDADNQPQLWIRYMDDRGGVIQVTRVNEAPGAFAWSPDGRYLAFTMLVPKPVDFPIDLPVPPEGAKWTGPPQIVDRLHYRADRIGALKQGWTHLFVVPADGGTPREVTRDGFNVGARFDGLPMPAGIVWLSDGHTIVYDGDADPDADHHYLVSNLYSVDVQSGDTHLLTADPGFWHSPVLSPDGKWIAFTGFAKTTKSYQAEDLFVVHPDGTGMHALTTGLDRDPQSVAWSDNETLWFSAENQGVVNTWTASVKTPGAKAASNGTQVLSLNDISPKGGFGVATRSTPSQPAELVRFSFKKPFEFTPLTHVNDDLLLDLRLGEVEELSFHSADNTLLQGWLVKPPGFDPAKKYPLIMEIHGGPHGMYNVAFNPAFQDFAAYGNLVLYMNPRGSTGYGTEFGNAIEKAYPGVDYDDLMAGVNEAIGRGWVDTTRMYVGGCSGGGVLSSWVIGHTNRFAAAAVRCPVIDWISFAGQTDIPLFTYDFFAQPFWVDPTEWFKHSPLQYVGNVTTPTLLMTGQLDLRTPIAQTEEFYSALKARGIPAMMIRVAGEYHGTASIPSNWMRTQLYMMAWYQRYTRR